LEAGASDCERVIHQRAAVERRIRRLQRAGFMGERWVFTSKISKRIIDNRQSIGV
jgi:hydroxypyruvate isomerase